LTTGDDTVDFSGTSNNTITATDGTLTSGDQINAGNPPNRLILNGGGTFDLTAPLTLTGIDTVEETAGVQVVTLRAGLPVTVMVDSGVSGGESVTLANVDDSFQGGSSGSNNIYATAAIVAVAAIDGGSSSYSSIQINGNDQLVSFATNTAITNITYVNIAGSNITFDPGTEGVAVVYSGGTGNTVMLNSTTQNAVDYAGANTYLFTNGDTLDVLAAAQPTPPLDSLVDFDSSDTLQIGNLDPNQPASVSYDTTTGVLTVSGLEANTGNTLVDTFQLRGTFSDNFAIAPSGDGFGYLVTYGGPDQTVAVLTQYDDSVGAGTTLVVATDSTLTGGDVIAPDPGTTLDLVGAGSFDLTQPQTLNNIAAIVVESPDAVVTLRQGTVIPVTLSAAGHDTLTFANASDTVNTQGGGSDTFNATADQARNITIAAGPFSTLNINDNTNEITIGSNITGITYLGLNGGSDALDPSASGATTIYVYDVIGGGRNTILLNDTTTSAVEYARVNAQTQPDSDNFFFDASATSQALTIAYANAPTENLYGFNSASTVALLAFATASLTVSDDSASIGAPATLLTIDGTDATGTSITQTLQLFGAYTGTFSVDPNTLSSGYLVSYAGAAPNNTLTTNDDTISGATDVYAADNTFNFGDQISFAPGGILHLIGTGSFVLNNPAQPITNLATIDAAYQHQSITLAPDPVTVDINSAGHDVIFNLTDQDVINGGGSGNNYAQSNSGQINGLNVDFGASGHNQIQIDDAGYTLVLNAPNVKNVESFSIQQNAGIVIDTGNFEALSGQKVEIDIAVSAGATNGPDTVFLRGDGEQVTDFFGGNTFDLLGPNQIINADVNGQGSPAEVVFGFDQTDTLNLPFLDTINLSTTIDQNAQTTTLLVTGTQFGNSYSQSFQFQGIYDGTFVPTHSAQFSNGYSVTYTPCYAEGTRIAILDADGRATERAVEDVRAGDVALLADGRTRPVVWVGSRRIDVARHPDPKAVAPIRIAAGAVAPGLPRRDLTVSPDHAVMVDGALIPARLLVNGASIRRLDVKSVRYLHIELDAHDLLLAEGLAAESYLDTGNRATFSGAVLITLHPDLSPAPRADGMPVATAPERVRPVWERLAHRAGVAIEDAAETATLAAPTLVVDGVATRGMRVGPDRIAFALPAGARAARLVSAASRPSDACPWLDDRRRLGVPVARIEADGVALPLDAPAFGAGWHATERDGARAWRWTDGNAAIALPEGTSLLTVTLTQACDSKARAA
jgi:hypothetical protein